MKTCIHLDVNLIDVCGAPVVSGMRCDRHKRVSDRVQAEREMQRRFVRAAARGLLAQAEVLAMAERYEHVQPASPSFARALKYAKRRML